MVTVEVTAEDIKHGVPTRCDTCPVARALARATGKHALVSYTFAYVCSEPFKKDDEGTIIDHDPGHDHVYYDLPDSVSAWIRAFDSASDIGDSLLRPIRFEAQERLP